MKSGFCTKLTAVLLSLLMVLALAGCAAQTAQPEETAAPEVITALTDADVDSLMGTWYATAITMNGQTVGFELLGGSIHIEVNPDGTATLFTGDNAEESKWTRESDAIVIGDMRLEKTTDGARLSFEGLPCPNLCAGGENFHGRFEYVPVEDMEKITELLATIIWNIAK